MKRTSLLRNVGPVWIAIIAHLATACGDGSDADREGANGPSGGDAAPETSVVGDPAGRFSFFVTSLVAIRALSGNPEGFGGDLRFGKADGLAGADEICRQVAELSMPENKKTWRAFLSVTRGPDGNPVHAIDRVGEGPWYDRLGRLFANARDDLPFTRPRGADPAIINDLPNENGIPNHDPEGTGAVDNHDFLTGTGVDGKLYNMDWGFTCHDWTSAVPTDGRPHCGHTWPTRIGGGPIIIRDGGRPPPQLPEGGIRGFDGGFPGGFGNLDNWMSALDEAGCAPGVHLIQDGPPNPNRPTVGSGGGYGGIYCFALSP